MTTVKMPEAPAYGLPLSFAQERMWFLARMEPENTSYNLHFAYRIPGALDAAALERALRETVRRHEVLRTTYREVQGRAVQVVGTWEDVSLPCEDLRSLDAVARAATVRARSAAEFRAPLPLDHGPVFRAALLRLADDEHVLLWTVHHIASDAWSQGLLLGELKALYAAYARGEAPSLAPPALQYADYAVWQRKRMSGERMQAQLDWWRAHLAGAPTLLELPADRPRPARQSHRGAVHRFAVDARLAARLAEIGRAEGASPFMTYLAAYQVLLAGHTGQDEFVIGTPIANRPRRELEGVIGFFLNTLAVRADVRGAPTFRELLRRVRDTLLGAYAHQDLPFERLVEELKVERSLGHHPLFQTMFILQHAEGGAQAAADGLALEPYGTGASPATHFDLSLSLQVGEAGARGAVEYATDLFDAGTVAALAGRFGALLERVAAAPDTRLCDLPLLDDAEMAAARAASAPAATFNSSATLHGWFAAQAAARPSAPALSFDGGRMTYGELDARSNQLARHLQSRGVGPEVKVGLFCERGPGLVVALLAILKAGGAYVPMDPAYPADRLAHILGDSGVALLLTEHALRGSLPHVPCEALYLDADWPLVEGLSAAPVQSAATPDSLAYVIYTSGSTGKPKGCEVTHRNVARLFRATDAWFGFGADDVWTLFHSAAFDFSVWEIWGALLYGGRLVVVPFYVSREPERFHALLHEEGVTVLNQTPSAFRQLIQADAAGPRLERLRCVVFGGEALEPSSLAPWTARYGLDAPRLVNMYGITETTVHVTYRPIAADDVRRGGTSPIGIPIPDLAIRLLDRHGRPVPDGVAGEIHVGGAGVARGYLNRPELTAARFVRDPFSDDPHARLYRSGDLARRLAGGELEYLGRMDEQVKVRGFRIELGEIEAALARHPAVREAVVVLRTDGPGEPRLVAYLTGAPPAAAELREHLRRDLPDYMVPAAFVPLDALPLTGNGKVDRRALPAPEAPAGGADGEPRTPTEAVVAAIWAELLGAECVGPADDFFLLGGHSLLAARVASRVREVFGTQVSLRTVFEAPVLADFAARVDAARGAAAGGALPAVRPAPREGGVPLSFAQEPLWFLHHLQPESPAYNMAFALRLDGALNADALGRALDEVVRRHEALRTVFRPAGDGAVQQVLAPAPLGLAAEDLTPLAPDARLAEARRRAAAEAEAPFDLGAGPLLRARLLRLEAEAHVLLLTTHHIAFDGWSWGIVLRELHALYGAFAEGGPSPLAAPALQYADFAGWQRRNLAGARLEAELDFWRAELAGAPAVLELPTDYPRPATPSARGGVHAFDLAAETADALRALARAEGCTLFMAGLAAFALLLQRHAGQDEVLVGTNTAGRGRPELEGVVGFFTGTTVVRADLSGEPSFRALLRRVRERSLGALLHADVPFERVVDAVQPERVPGANPLFQALFLVQNLGGGRAALPGLRVAPFGEAATGAKFDLMLVLHERARAIRGHLVYAADLFHPDTAARMAEHYRALLESAVAAPDAPVGELSMGAPAAVAAASPFAGALDADFGF
jgi:amino acid adenylation domain-containing protein